MKAVSSSSDQSPSDNKTSLPAQSSDIVLTWDFNQSDKISSPCPPIFDKKTPAKQQDAKPSCFFFFSGYTDDASVQGSKNLAGPI